MKKVKALVITGFGVNCEEEMAAAYKLAGAESEIVHLNDILLGKVNIFHYDVLNFPGGFSFGDDLGSGKVLANKIRYKVQTTNKTLIESLREFVDSGKFIFGVCNGFQALVKMGLLPDINGTHNSEVTLTKNNSGKFEDRWVTCKVVNNTNSPFLKDINIINLPVRHGEGKLVIKNDQIKEKILSENLNCIGYCDESGNLTDNYPKNPNGSDLNMAGLSDSTGRILGMMPHPEAYLSFYNNPNWGQIKRENPNYSEDGEGLKIFKNIVEYIKNKN